MAFHLRLFYIWVSISVMFYDDVEASKQVGVSDTAAALGQAVADLLAQGNLTNEEFNEIAAEKEFFNNAVRNWCLLNGESGAIEYPKYPELRSELQNLFDSPKLGKGWRRFAHVFYSASDDRHGKGLVWGYNCFEPILCHHEHYKSGMTVFFAWLQRDRHPPVDETAIQEVAKESAAKVLRAFVDTVGMVYPRNWNYEAMEVADATMPIVLGKAWSKDGVARMGDTATQAGGYAKLQKSVHSFGAAEVDYDTHFVLCF
ncbi:unnamed protein product, partial [Mesorhabditis spiculigera]